MKNKPNFLILMVDQLTGTFWDDGPAPFLHAPNLRALHERSVNFSNAYSPSPLSLDGQSLVAAALGDEDEGRLVACEYMAEGSVSTLVTLRQGPWKYVYCEADPVQLYNLYNDPQELSNVAGNAEHADTLAHFTALRESRWNLDILDEDVRENQQRRIVCYEALREGRFTPWDHQPVQDASQRFMRNHLDLNDVEAGNRVPVRPTTPPMNHGSN